MRSSVDPFDRDPATLDASDRKLLSDVRSHGFHIVLVTSGLPGHENHELDPGEPDWVKESMEGRRWAFSVGLVHTWQHPEVIVFGLDDRSLSNTVSLIGQGVAAGGTFEVGKEYEDVLEGRPIRFVDVSPDWYSVFLGYAQWFYRGEFPVLQVLWPDQLIRFPPDPKSLASPHQPILSLPPSS
jgi:hypothetical protein